MKLDIVSSRYYLVDTLEKRNLGFDQSNSEAD